MPKACPPDPPEAAKSNTSPSGDCVLLAGDPNWKVSDLIPQPTLLVSGKVRDRLAGLTVIYALEDEGS